MLKFKNPDYTAVSSREWIVTNGIGGYASSSLCGANTRRYHGLLVASYNPPTDRRVLLSCIDEKITSAGHEYQLSSHQYPGVIHPDGYIWLTSFERIPFPKGNFSSQHFSISKTVLMVYGSNVSVIEYHNTGNQPFDLELTPLFVNRDYHHLFTSSSNFDFRTEVTDESKLKVFPAPEAEPFWIWFTRGNFSPQKNWYRNLEYDWERKRGLDFTEDAMSIGQIHSTMAPDEKLYFVIAAQSSFPDGSVAEWKAKEKFRLKSLLITSQNEFARDLAVSGDQFLVWRLSSGSFSMIAGYHWFTDWGRDTMIAMRGLVIATGKKQVAKSIFRTFLKYLDKGMIPNRFPDEGEKPEYNTIDATLWLFVSLYEYDQAFGDPEFIGEVYPQLTDIIQSHLQGTRYYIHVTKEGLLSGGDEGTQLTWMDARVGDKIVTPRQGCPVEINALWFNALSIYVAFGKKIKRPVSEIEKQIRPLQEAFRRFFVNEKGYLNDVIVPGFHIDDSIRPNQVYAISLPFSPLTQKESESVLKVIEKHLYTELGLRSLSPEHPDFKRFYSGNTWERDHAYHQGTVWSYLWGEYAMAYLNVHQHSSVAKRWVLDHMKAIKNHFYHEDGLYAISEIFDGWHPDVGKGCIHQAWSVGMTLKVLLMCLNEENTHV